MPWIEITCVCGCGGARRVYHQPSRPRPKFVSRQCLKNPPPGFANRRWVFTPEMDAAIRRAWLSEIPGKRMARARRDVPALADFPKYMINYRARMLGVAAITETRWTREEDAILEQWAGDLCIERIRLKLKRAGYQRSVAAIALRVNRRYQRGAAGRELTAFDASRILGWEWHVVVDWIKAGKLRALRAAGRWRIHPADLATFIRDEARLLSQRRVDLERVVELLEEHRAAGRPRTQSA